MSESRKRMGRPALPEGDARTRVFSVRITDVERKEIDKAAAIAGESAGDWARRVLSDAARRA